MGLLLGDVGMGGGILKIDAAFVKAVVSFLWKRFKYISLSWKTWWYVYIPGELINVSLGIATWYFFTYYLVNKGQVSDIVGYIVLGMGVNTLLHSALVHTYWAVYGLYSGYLESAGFRLRQWEYYSLAGIPRYVAMAGYALFDTLRSFLVFILYLVSGALFFGFRPSPRASYLGAFVVLALGYFGTLSLGILLASSFWFFIRYRELSLNPLVWMIEVLIPVVCGIYYPRGILPQPLYMLGSLFPQTYAVEGLRRALGVEPGSPVSDILVLLFFTGLLPFSLKVFKKSEEWAIKKSGVL